MNDTTSTTVNIAQVWAANLAAWAAVMANLNTFLIGLSAVLASAYTIYKFVSDRKRKN